MSQQGDAATAPAATFDLVLRGCRVAGRPAPVDVAVSDGVIVAVTERLDGGGDVELAVDGRLVGPAFVQPHIHLDKVGTLPLLGENRTGTLAEAIEILHRTKRAATPEEISERAGVVIRQAVLAGTTSIRTHVDVDTIGGLAPLRGVVRAAQEHADLCDVQIVAFPQEGILRDPGTFDLLDQAMTEGATVVGGMPHWELSPEASARHVDLCLDLAQRYHADVDMHVDETDAAASRTLAMVVDATAQRGWGGRVTAGHCCAMAAWEDDYAARVIKDAVAAGVMFVTNPATNLLLQGRADREPRRRGLPRVKEMLDAGAIVACGQDCVQDGFYPFGAADPLQTALILCHAAQLSTPAEIDQALESIKGAAARVLGLEGYGVDPGCFADLVVLDADDPHEALRLTAPRRWVIRRGSVIAETEVRSSLIRAEGD